jgi:hypothetical protein
MAALDTGSYWRCTSFILRMAHQLSDHLWSAGILVVAALVALAAERLAGEPAQSVPLARAANEDIGGFVTPVRSEGMVPSTGMAVGIDPFGGQSRESQAEYSVVETGPSGAGPARVAAGRRLTAILVADNRRVAVIDDATVGVGDLLRDGSRVSAIQVDRVWVVNRAGQWQMLSLRNQAQ